MDVLLSLHPRHLVLREDSMTVRPCLADDITPALVDRTSASAAGIRIRIKAGALVAETEESPAEAVELVRLPLLLAEVRRVGALGIVVTPAAPAAEAALRVWLLLAQGEDAAVQALEAFRSHGALRSDMEGDLVVEGDLLGKGVSADVYRATSTHTGRSFAAKQFKAGTLARMDGGTKDLLTHEISILIALQGHPNIVKFAGIFHLAGPSADASAPALTLAMELGSGTIFRAVRKSPFTEVAAKPVMHSVLSGLEHMHFRGFIHRDLKPENVLLRDDGSAALVDFGLACVLDDQAGLARPCGSPGYIAPEVLLKAGACTKSDVWSAGCIFYLMLSRRHAFKGDSTVVTLRKSARGKVNLKLRAFDDISPACMQLLEDLLAVPLDARPEAREALEETWFLLSRSKAVSTPELPGCAHGDLAYRSFTTASHDDLGDVSRCGNSMDAIESCSTDFSNAMRMAPSVISGFSDEYTISPRCNSSSIASGERLYGSEDFANILCGAGPTASFEQGAAASAKGGSTVASTMRGSTSASSGKRRSSKVRAPRNSAGASFGTSAGNGSFSTGRVVPVSEDEQLSSAMPSFNSRSGRQCSKFSWDAGASVDSEVNTPRSTSGSWLRSLTPTSSVSARARRFLPRPTFRWMQRWPSWH
mmetsp:Transcript_114955/g.332174  ORF Transcript_114955/g.332174 Transcript_114955/m.332174 type:complete len:647 (+) Transcript_114955:29-1969(+)